jgi:prophage regulatory protein
VQSESAEPISVIRLAEVRRRTGQSTSSLYAAMARGDFPKPIKLSTRAVGWLARDVEAWIEARVAERDAWQAVRAAKRVVKCDR